MIDALRLLLVAILVASGLLNAQVDPVTTREAERLLLEAPDPGLYRELGATLIARDPVRARELAAKLAAGDWRRQLTALAIWRRLGGRVLLEEAILRRDFDRGHNFALRARSLAALAGSDLSGAEDRVTAGLDDPVWIVRAAALEAVGTLAPEVLGRHLPRILSRLDDDVATIRHHARAILLGAADRSEPILDALLRRSWWEWPERAAKRKLIWAAFDARARGIAIDESLVRSSRDDPFSKALDLAFDRSGAERMKVVLGILLDDSSVELLGDDLVRALLEIAVADPDWLSGHDWNHRSLGGAPLAPLVAVLLPDAGRRFQIVLARALVVKLDIEAIEEAVLREAFERRPENLAAMLDTFFDEIGSQGASRRRLRRIMKLRSVLDVALPEDLLLRGLEEGPFPRRVIVGEQIWRRSDARLREQLLGFVRQDLDRLDRAREPLMRILIESPREEAIDLYEEVLRESVYPDDLRIKAADVLVRLEPKRHFDAALVESVAGELRMRLIEHEIGAGKIGRELVEHELGDLALADIDLDLLRLASMCEFKALDRQVVEHLKSGAFTARRLPAYIAYLQRRFGADRARQAVEGLIDRCIDATAEERELNAFSNMDGKVLEHLIGEYRPGQSMARLFALVTVGAVDEADRVVLALSRLARQRDERAEFARLLTERWVSLVSSEGQVPAQAALDAVGRELLLTGDPHLRELVIKAAESALDACAGLDLAREEVYGAAVLLESVFQTLVESGDARALAAAIGLIARAGDCDARARLADPRQAGHYDPRASMLSVLVAESRAAAIGSLLDGAIESQPELRGDDRFWLDWARQSLRFPDPGPLGSMLARHLLSLPPALLVGEDHVLLALGARLLASGRADLGAGLVALAERLAPARVPGRDAEDDFERIILRSGIDQAARFWLVAETELRLRERSSAVGGQEDPSLDTDQLWHRRSDDRRYVGYLALRSELGLGIAPETLAHLARDGDDFAGIDAMRLRAALDARRFEEARTLARRALERIAVFGASERDGDLQFFSSWEAAALWGLDRRDEARLLLERVGIRSLGALRGPTAADFR